MVALPISRAGRYPFCMARLLFTVENRFAIRNRGVVVVPGIVVQGDERFRVDDPLELRKPDGVVVFTRIAGLEWSVPRQADRSFPLLLPIELTKGDVPVGAEVWSVDPPATQS